MADLVQSLPAEQQQRLYPLMCGFNPTDKLAVRDVKRLYERYPGVWCGIGELLLQPIGSQRDHGMLVCVQSSSRRECE